MTTEEPRVLAQRHLRRRAATRPWDDDKLYRVVGWVGVVLALAALSDFALALYPLGFGSPEWELATIGAIVQGLPLFSIGLAAIWVGAGRGGRKWLLVVVGWVLVVAAALLLAALLLFLTDVPLAIKATQAVARVGIYKLVARTLFMGGVFGISYVVMAVMALRQARGKSPGETIA
jgi:hypothetical protein